MKCINDKNKGHKFCLSTVYAAVMNLALQLKNLEIRDWFQYNLYHRNAMHGSAGDTLRLKVYQLRIVNAHLKWDSPS